MNPAQITFRGMEVSDALTEHIQSEYENLFRFNDRIQSCHVTVEQPHRHKRQGREFQVHLSLKIPGRELAVTRAHEENLENPHALVEETFRAARRMLSELNGRRVAQRTESKEMPVPTAEELELLSAG